MYEKYLKPLERNCKCGKTHKNSTEVILEEHAFDRIGEAAKKLLACGRVAVVYFEDTEAIAERVRRELIRAGYKVTKVCFAAETEPSLEYAEELLELSEDIRMLISVGSGSVSEMSRYAAEMRGCKLLHCLTAPSTDSIFFDYAEFWQSAERVLMPAKAPDAVIADLTILSLAPRRLVAGGYGTLMSKYLALFEAGFERFTLPSKNCRVFDAEIKLVLDAFFGKAHMPDDEDFIEKLTGTLLAVGMLEQAAGVRDFLQTAEHNLSMFMRNGMYAQMSAGENKFIISYLLVNLYRSMLAFDGTDLLFPPDKIAALKYLNQQHKLPLAKNILKLDGGPKPDYQKTTYLIGEYREDLLAELYETARIFKQHCKIFRRIYEDAGYFLKNCIEPRALMKTIAAVSVVSPRYGYLEYLRDSGVFAKYIG